MTKAHTLIVCAAGAAIFAEAWQCKAAYEKPGLKKWFRLKQTGGMEMDKLSVIWDVTRWCPWNCQICCMGAVSDSVCRQKELTYEEKLNVLAQLNGLRYQRDVRLDMSGGEIMMDKEHLELIQQAAKLFGKDKVGISTSGINIDENVAKLLAEYTSDVELTLDCHPEKEYRLRRQGYHKRAAAAIDILKIAGVRVGVQTVLCRANNHRNVMQELLKWLCQHNVDVWSIIKFFPVGRGMDYESEQLSEKECEEAVQMIREIYQNSQGEKPKLDFHYLMPGHEKSATLCRCVTKSIGILPDGTVTACFWALDRNMQIADEKYWLGNVKEKSLAEILQGEKAKYWLANKQRCELFCA